MIFKSFQGFINQINQKFLHMLRLSTFQSIKRRILQKSSEEISPSYPIHTLLLILNSSIRNFSIKMVMKLSNKSRFNRERVIQILPIEILFTLFYKYASNSLIIELRSTSSTNHLQNISHGHIYISFSLRVEELSSLNNYQSGRQIYPPSKGTSSN